MNTLSFREKTILGTLIATLAVTAGYYINVAPLLLRGAKLYEFLGPAIVAVVATVVVQIINQVLIASTDTEVPVDERDRNVDLRATWFAHATLYSCCVLGIGAVITASVMDLPLLPAFIVHAVSASITLADIVRYVMQLVGYRCFL